MSVFPLFLLILLENSIASTRDIRRGRLRPGNISIAVLTLLSNNGHTAMLAASRTRSKRVKKRSRPVIFFRRPKLNNNYSINSPVHLDDLGDIISRENMSTPWPLSRSNTPVSSVTLSQNTSNTTALIPTQPTTCRLIELLAPRPPVMARNSSQSTESFRSIRRPSNSSKRTDDFRQELQRMRDSFDSDSATPNEPF